MHGLRSIFGRLGRDAPPTPPTPSTPPQPQPQSVQQVLREDQKNGIDREFKLARRSDPIQWYAEHEVREWATTKQRTMPAICDEPVIEGGIYRALRDPYEIRVMEVLPGVGDEMVRCRLIHCSIEFELKYPKVSKHSIALKGGRSRFG
jgi:hypothetical protein